MTAYRRDIDGLRALAIMPVVQFHLGVGGFSGGFVGVDIFFVISGFLITGIIASEIDAGGFSFARFYERRARRILPALLVMIAFVMAGASWLFLPQDFGDVPWSALSALAFLANIWFYIRTNYFSGSSETMPLLHTWSLAVEEQFYLAMPLLLWAIARWMPHRRVLILASAGLVSLGACLALEAAHPAANFYLPVTRAWELLAGAVLATVSISPLQRRGPREVLAATGLGLIAFAVHSFDRTTPYPGIAAVLPVLGSALLLLYAPGTWTGRLLAARIPVALGLISYSLYLWHWPLIAFTEYVRDEPLAGWWSAGIMVAALLIAWASWRFVEQPLRNSRRLTRRRFFTLTAGSMAAMGLAAAAVLPLGGWEARFSPEVVRISATAREYSTRKGNCIARALGDYPSGCMFGAAAAPTTLVWGDSHSYMMARELGEELKPQGKALVLHSFAGCPPMLGLTEADFNPGCAAFNARVIDYLGQTPSIKRVYLAFFWSNEYYQRPGMVGRIEAIIARIRAAGKSVVIVGPVPVQPFNVPRRLSHQAAWGRLDQVHGASAADYARQAGWFTANYARWRNAGVTILDPARALVAGGQTKIMSRGVPLYIDTDHLSSAGVRAVLAADPSR